MAVTCVVYAPDLAQWKCAWSPGRTTTLPTPNATNLVSSNDFPEPNVKNTLHDRVDPILRMLVRHHFCATRQMHPNRVWTGLGRITNQNREPSGRWKRGKGLP